MSSEQINKFILWYNNEFKFTRLYQNMGPCREDSPYHREQSVALHTDMVVMEYLKQPTHPDDIMGLFAAAFHDVGKPSACKVKFKEERGEYKSFGGHEIYSARLWEDWAVENWKFLVEEFNFEPEDIYRVGYLIEYHKPWDLKDASKLEALSLTTLMLNVDEIFVKLFTADTWGRMSDDYMEKRSKVANWADDFINRCHSVCGHPILSGVNYTNAPTLYVPIGASGAGKSSLYNKFDGVNTFSLDAMRHELYGDDYAYAYELSTKDAHFKSKSNQRFMELVRENKDLYLDNTNTSRKNRRWFMTEARKRGYRLVALLLPVALQTIIDRQHTRGDKNVPAEAVKRQYMGIQLPQYGEFDEINVIKSNLK